MEILNRTPFRFAFLSGRVEFPKHSLTLIVKGTFDLRDGDVAALAEEQPYPTGDEPYPDDEDGTGPARYENDFAPLKPRTDLLFVGNCHAPSGKKLPFCRATFRVGHQAKTIMVLGDREWKGLLARPSDPEPFSSMPIRYENSFGGAKLDANPIGKGHKPEKDEDGKKFHPLPNLENPDQLIRSKNDKPDPVGFGPMGRLWTERLSKTGTYDDHWKEKRFPGLPEDFDWGHFNAAHPDLQTKRYLKGDEEIVMENLHPEVSPYRTELPGLRVRCFVERAGSEQDGSPPFDEVVMNLDTVWVDAESEKLVLVWRGVTEVETEEYEDVQNIFVTTENVSEQRLSLDQNHTLFLQALEELRLEWGELEEEEEEEEEPAEEDAVEAQEEVAPEEELEDPQLAEMKAEAAEAKAAGLGIPGAEQLAEQARILAELEALEEAPEPEEPPATALTREEVERRITEGEPLSGLDLRGLDLSKLTAAEVDFSESNLEGVVLSGSVLTGAVFAEANLSGANLSQCDLTEANLASTNLERALFFEANLKDADLTGSRMASADLSSATIDGAVFENVKLPKGRLGQVEGNGAVFTGALLDDANFESSNLEATNFAGASLRGACFRGASLRDSNWSEVRGQEIILDDAELTGLRASGCDLSRGSLRAARGEESIWKSATLSETDFSFVDMAGASFIDATLDHATFEAADMPFARFNKANLRQAKLITMNLFQGSLEKADLTNADLSGSNMYGVEFLEATTKNTIVRGTNLKMANQYKNGRG